MTFTIRDYRTSDVEAVHEILVAGSTIRGTMRLPYQAKSQTEERLQDREGAIRLVAAEAEAGVVAFLELLTYPSVARHRHVGMINLVAVHEGHQGRGVGRGMMDAAIDLADNWLQLKRLELFVWTTNESAVRLYKSLGFEQEGTLRDWVFQDGRFLDAYLMARLNPVGRG